LLPLLASCQRGPQYCIFDGTIIGAAPQPFVAMNPDGTVDETRTRYTWREFVWPTDPAWTHVRREGAAWLFEGTTGGTPWTFRGVFSADAGSGFVRTDATGTPPRGRPSTTTSDRSANAFSFRARTRPPSRRSWSMAPWEKAARSLPARRARRRPNLSGAAA